MESWLNEVDPITHPYSSCDHIKYGKNNQIPQIRAHYWSEHDPPLSVCELEILKDILYNLQATKLYPFQSFFKIYGLGVGVWHFTKHGTTFKAGF